MHEHETRCGIIFLLSMEIILNIIGFLTQLMSMHIICNEEMFWTIIGFRRGGNCDRNYLLTAVSVSLGAP